MSRFSLVAGCAVLGIAAVIIASKRAESAAADAIVRLQQSTPGVQQIGHANLSGTIVAGQFEGGGAGLTNINAGLLDGFDSTEFLQSVPIPLTLNGTSSTQIFRAENDATDTGAAAIFGLSTAPTGITYGGRFESNSPQGSAVYGASQSPVGFCFGGKFMNASADGVGVYAESTATNGTNWGGFFANQSTSGRGVSGIASAPTGTTYGVFGVSYSSTGSGVEGTANSSTGYGIGVHGVSECNQGTGVGGTTTTTLEGYGVWGSSSGVIGRGVFGDVSSNTGLNYGVYGRSASIDGRGVYGETVCNSPNANGFGILGYSLAPQRWAIYAAGSLGASGTKSFRIDHPSDPTNKYLLHYCAEGPEPRNVYQGQVTTGADGYAWVDLPDYYQEINKDPLIQLTVVDTSDDFVQVKVSQRVSGNRFQLRTNKGNVEVDWRVDAVRNDRWVQRNGAPVVIEKIGLARGKYQHPELYGAPPNMGEFYCPQRHDRDGMKLDHP